MVVEQHHHVKKGKKNVVGGWGFCDGFSNFVGSYTILLVNEVI
jgi:hypothetical protein